MKSIVLTSKLSASRIALASVISLLLAGCGTKASNDTFSLTSTPIIASKTGVAKGRQILVPEPTALKALDSEQVVVRLSNSEIQYLSNSQWSDKLPRLVQAKLVQAFENTGKLGGVGKPGEGLAIDYQVQTSIRSFEVTTGANSSGTVEIFAKLVNDRNGSVHAQQVFRATVPVAAAGNANYVQALDQAFAQVTSDIVAWTLRSI
ncbi:membrane integrity-associated transporter subunit PqiC [Rhizobium sp. CFBP 8762]|uniref:ABC-type transport auxiliary lipoprotein family protein n=1 Tax=Rhizobium sp. CFBP 8762 TaxID=2775279 RepID=UPI00177A7EFB|nr:ABC-type transport auxiliary lipoprotein family protein [Rhizobium sp. CFBP 8762]MBD8555828.1 membrane integrity-associated transporter subunit PqiC [Rhizobium sp. CFBP 8762]